MVIGVVFALAVFRRTGRVWVPRLPGLCRHRPGRETIIFELAEVIRWLQKVFERFDLYDRTGR